ncbi:MAG: hypothetical protein IKT63_00315 [Oscillospiraceae bacterium]|nr:hypothetical protein [Oscillospiraceae bacterium]
MKKKLYALTKYIFIAVPMIMGIIGYGLMEGAPLLQSIYISTSLYGFGADDIPPNIIIEIARWLGPVATASTFIIIVKFIRRSFLNRFAYIKGNSTAVYGPDAEKEAILEQLGFCGIDGRTGFLKAHRYILLGSEEENLAFFNRYKNEISGRDVYAACSSLSAQSVAHHNLHLFCPEETAASVFWKEHCIYSLSKSKNHKLKIVFIGFEKLGRELLLSALQSNIFSPSQQIDYHIFGDADGFCNIHHQIDKTEDNIIFHYKQWHEQIALINSADMVIVLSQENQAQLLRSLTLACSCEKIYFFSAVDYITDIMENQDRLVSYKWKEVASTVDNILESTLFRNAKQLNLRYAHLYSGTEETSENAEKEWQKLDTFTRYSNISAADYLDIMKIILKEENQGNSVETMSAQWFETLAHLEHIRWCRYHYINNWQYGQPEKGRKDKTKRIHADLVPYESLTEAEKDKDRENIRILFP